MTTRIVGRGDRPRLHRDRFTVSLYGYFVAWGWFLYSFNPSVSLLAEDLGISNAAAGLHGTAMAVGTIGAAVLGPRLVLRFSRRTAFECAGVLVVTGLAVLLTGRTLPVTLTAVVLLSVGGSTAISAAQAGLALHHGRTASAAVTEGNAAGSGIGLLGPLAVGACVGLGWGWRPAVAVSAVLMLLAVVATRRLPMEGALARSLPAPAAGRSAGRLDPADPGAAGHEAAGRAARWFLVTIVTAVSLENATTYWATDLVIDRTGAGADIATATTAGLVTGMTVARLVVGPLSLRMAPARLLAAAYGVAVVGWAVLWTATVPWAALVGLFVAGIGYGVHYPIGTALLLGTADGATDRAQARATVAGGAAVGVAPFLLGALADSVGSHTAFLLVPVLAVVGGLATLRGAHAWHRAVAAGC
ncbi:MAG TPA: MFS transporter [Cellulomonas sp.]